MAYGKDWIGVIRTPWGQVPCTFYELLLIILLQYLTPRWFEEGKFRKKIQFMYAGNLMTIKLKFYGGNPEPILDRLPTARVIEQYDHECTIEAEVYGKGCIMWLLSQADKVEILKPERLRNEFKETLNKIVQRYL